MNPIKSLTAMLILLGLLQASLAAAPAEARLIEARKIWDAGGHNAFTDLIRWHDHWWCCFRESRAHVGGEGKIRVIESTDGEQWTSAALLDEKDVDLRDPKFSVAPGDRLMLVVGGSIYRAGKLTGRRPRVMFSADGHAWSEPKKVLAEGDWLWRITWRDNIAYGTSYTDSPATATAPARWTVTLYRSADGIDWQSITPFDIDGQPNETTLRFDQAGNMLALVRRETGNGWFGKASPPFKEWAWHELNYKLGGPDFRVLPDGTMIAATRDVSHKNSQTLKATTMVARLTPTELIPLLTLPSGGDCSYPGMAMDNGLLWISYYSSHEGKTSVYLAKVQLPSAN